MDRGFVCAVLTDEVLMVQPVCPSTASSNRATGGLLVGIAEGIACDEGLVSFGALATMGAGGPLSSVFSQGSYATTDSNLINTAFKIHSKITVFRESFRFYPYCAKSTDKSRDPISCL